MKYWFLLILLFTPNVEATDDWYFLISAGVGKSGHSSVDKLIIDNKKNLGAANNYTGSSDFPGIFRKISDTELIGPSFRVYAENYTENWKASEGVVFHNYNYSLSYLKFLNKPVGDGFFLRADVGYSELWIIQKTSNVELPSRSTGVFTGLGAGYGWSMPNNTHFIITLEQSYSDLGDRIFSGNSLYVGFIL